VPGERVQGAGRARIEAETARPTGVRESGWSAMGSILSPIVAAFCTKIKALDRQIQYFADCPA
jgi:hypothetical protein